MLSCVLNLVVFILGISVTVCLLALILGYEQKENTAGFFVGFAAVFLFNLFILIFVKDREVSEFITEVSLSASIMFLPYFLLKSKKKFTFFWFGLIVCSTFDYFESLIIYFIKNPSPFCAQIIYIALYSAALIAIICVYKFSDIRVPPDFLEQLSPALGIVIFLADYSSYYDIMLDRDSAYYAEVSVVLKILSTALIVGCFSYIVYLCSTYSYKQKEAELHLEAELKHYEEMVRRNEDIRTFRHDYKNNLYSIKSLASAGKNEDIEKFIDNLDGEMKLSDNRYKTGNYLADAIISGKAEQAKKSGVSIIFSGVIPDKGIENSDLCAIISNALDNAIRGCEEIAPCKINIHSEITANGLTIKFSNPVKNNVVIKNDIVQTTKADRTNHGFGLSNIKKAAEKYDGYIELSCENKNFCIEIGLVLKKLEGVKNE